MGSIIKCKCGIYTTHGKNCSKCQDLDASIYNETDWNPDQLEVHADKIDDEVLEFIEEFNNRYKKDHK